MTPLKSGDPRGTYVVVCGVCIDRDLYNCSIPAGCAARSVGCLHSPPAARSTGARGLVMSRWLQTVVSLSFLCSLMKTVAALGLGRVEEAGAGSRRQQQSLCREGEEVQDVANAGKRGVVSALSLRGAWL